jgi:hypothetical protein
VTEDSSGCNSVGIVVCIDLYELLAADLIGNGFCGFFKRHGHLGRRL